MSVVIFPIGMIKEKATGRSFTSRSVVCVKGDATVFFKVDHNVDDGRMSLILTCETPYISYKSDGYKLTTFDTVYDDVASLSHTLNTRMRNESADLTNIFNE